MSGDKKDKPEEESLPGPVNDLNPGEDIPEDIPEEYHEVFHKLKEGDPEVFAKMTSFMATGPMGNPLYSKMNEGHIDKLLDLATSRDEREFTLAGKAQDNDADEGKSTRRYFFAVFFVVVLMFGFVLLYFKDTPNILIPVISGLGGIVAGFLGGFGFGKSK